MRSWQVIHKIISSRETDQLASEPRAKYGCGKEVVSVRGEFPNDSTPMPLPVLIPEGTDRVQHHPADSVFCKKVAHNYSI